MNAEIKKHIQASPSALQWEKIGLRPHHGIDIPLFSLHSQKSSGIGEFFDLMPLIDWCSEIGFDTIQLLPLNDTGDVPSPYNALSSCALNPLYLSLEGLPFLDKPLKEKLKDFKKYNRTPRILYEVIYKLKLHWLRHYYDTLGPKIMASDDYQIFLQEHSWVNTYALFRVLKNTLREHPSPSTSLFEEYKEEVSFYSFLQYLCFQQMKDVKAFAASKNVFLLGDIPILISPESVDVWEYPQFFNLDLRAGAPPDTYNQEGQDWGFPTYDWDNLQKDDYRWWRRRLNVASQFFDLYRIDHVVGFYRIWAIPPGKSAKEGEFVPGDQKVWISHGEQILKMMLHSSLMLPIAEDLGTVPDEVRTSLFEMGISTTKVMRWERDWEGDGHFTPLDQYNPISLTCVSTHDSRTLAGWWHDFPEEASLYAKFKNWTYDPHLDLEKQRAILRDSHHTSSLFHVNLLEEYLTLIPSFVSKNPEDERINIPGKILPTNWTYRFRPSVEEITSNKDLKKILKNLIA